MRADHRDNLQAPPSPAAERLRLAYRGLIWSPWYTVPAPAAATLPEWVACPDCHTRTAPIATQGRDITGAVRVVVSYCPGCHMASSGWTDWIPDRMEHAR